MNNNKNLELKFEFGRVGVAFNIKHPRIRKQIALRYKDFASHKKPQVHIDIEYKNLLNPDRNSFIYKSNAWILASKNGYLFMYFPTREICSVVKFDKRLKRIKFYTKDLSGQSVLYHLPGVLYRLILPRKNAWVFHGCGILHNQKGYLFIAESEGGKSTIAKLALNYGLKVLNDERIIIRKEKNLFKIYSSPWYQEVKEIENSSSYIRQLFFLKKSRCNRIKPMSKTEALEKLIKNNFSLTISNDIIKESFGICLDLAEKLKCYWLEFKPDKSLWSFLNGFLK